MSVTPLPAPPEARPSELPPTWQGQDPAPFEDAARFTQEDPGVDLRGDDNPHKLVARYHKARKLAGTLLANNGNVESVRQLGQYELGRALAAEAAGTNVPSEVTWALVVALVEEAQGG